MSSTKWDTRRGQKPTIHKNPSFGITVPNHFRCPISLELMKDPVTLSTGITYDRESIDNWLEAGNRICPVTNQALTSMEQIPNHAIRRMIQDWCVANKSYGVERVPTSGIPVSRDQVREMLLRVRDASERGDQEGCLMVVKKIKHLMKESERNQRCVVENGACTVLSASLVAFAKFSIEKNARILGEILSSLTVMFPFDSEAQSYLGSRISLHCMEWFLNSGDMLKKRNSILVLKQLVSRNEKHVHELAKMDGIVEPLIRLIKEPICPTSTKASLMVIYYIVSSSGEHKSRFASNGLVGLLLELIIDSEKSICEKGLAVLDEMFDSKEGREKARGHSLSVPVLVKKLIRVSDLATEFAVSGLWKLCKNEKGGGGEVLVEALQVGAFQKILLLLQMGCGEKTKVKGSELLRMLNGYRGSAECVESADFKKLVRPF